MTFKFTKRSPLVAAVAVSGALAALTMAGAHAQGSGLQNNAQKGPWSVGASVGQSEASIPNSIGDNGDTSYKIFGGYQFNRNWGAELGYNHLGKEFGMAVPGGTASGKLTNWYGAAVGTLPLGERFSLLGKLGVARNEADFGSTGESHRTQPLLGVGAEYAFSPALSARLEYEDFGKFTGDGFGGNSGSIKATNISLGLKAKF